MSYDSDLKGGVFLLLEQKTGAMADAIRESPKTRAWDATQLRWLVRQIEKLPDKGPEASACGPVGRGRVHV